jgi:hypothetical protein
MLSDVNLTKSFSWEKQMKSVNDTLRAKEMQLATLQREVEILRAAAKIVGGDRRRSASKRGTGGMSQVQMIREVLLKQGGPLRAEKIAEAIEKRFNVKLKWRDITSLIYRAIRGSKFFRKEGINTFGLVEWQARGAGRSKK